jgi:hypothetical protein
LRACRLPLLDVDLDELRLQIRLLLLLLLEPWRQCAAGLRGFEAKLLHSCVVAAAGR